MRPEEFWDCINRSSLEQEEVKVEEITIGHTVNSTTVVPRVYGVGSLFVCDMPGFAETNKQKKISIDILQKIFLTCVPNSTLLIVADVALIQDTKAERLLQHYHRALQYVLGDQYDVAIEHFYFVLTKNHIDNLSSGRVREVMFAKAMEMMDSDMAATKFMKRLAKCNVLVDLRNDSDESLLGKINDMISRDLDSKKGREQATSWKVMKLQASENTLNRMAIRNLGMIRKQQYEMNESYNALVVELAKLKDSINEETENVRKERDIVLKDHQIIRKEQMRVQSILDLHAPTRAQLLKEIDETEAIIGVRKKQDELFEKHFEKAEFITYRCDVSKEVTRGKKYSIHLNVDTSGADVKERFVLVMDYETADATLRKFIGRGEKLLPRRLQDLRDIDLASVLYNSHKHVNLCKAEIVGASSAGVLTVKITHTGKFKVYVYTSAPFKRLSYYDDLKISFEEAMAEDAKKLARLKQRIKDLDQEKVNSEKKHRELKENLAQAKEAIGRFMDEASNKRQVHEKRCDEFQSSVSQLEKEMKAKKEDERLTLIAKVDDIFRGNKLEANLSQLLAETQATFVPLERDIKFLMEAVKRFEQDNSELLESLKAVDFSDEGANDS